MTGRRTIMRQPRNHDRYMVRRLKMFTQAIDDIYNIMADTDPRFADKWLNHVIDFVKKLEKPKYLGKYDSLYSDVLSYIKIPHTQTLAFMHVEDQMIYLCYAGKDTAPWPDIMKTVEPMIDVALEALRQRDIRQARKQKDKGGT